MSRSLRRVGLLSAVLSLLLTAFVSQPVAASSGAKLKSQHGARSVSASSLRAFLGSTPRVPPQDGNSQGGGVLANFDGVSSRDSAVTNFGAEFEPPDQGLCAGNGFVVEMVNSAFRVYDTRGHTLQGPLNVNIPFHDGLLDFTSDPRCHYDAATNTWFAVILYLHFTGSTPDASRVEIAYNTTGDPTTVWSQFKIDTTDLSAPKAHGCPCLGDQPTLGIDAYNLYTTTNEFSLSPASQFNGAQIYAISKSDLVHHKSHVHFAHYKNLTIGGSMAASVQPALTNGPAPAEYFLSSLDPNGTGDNRIGVWALTDVASVTTGRTPRLSSVIIGSEFYVSPPRSAQKGSTSTLDSNDDRMQQTQYINGQIWGELGTQVLPEGDTSPRAGVAWFRVTPELDGSRIESAGMNRQGYFAVSGNNAIYPAIQADGDGHAAMVFTLVGPNRFPSAAYSVLTDEGDFGRPVVYGAGTGPYDPTATRWGDYSWAVLDPTSDSVWMATEYIPPVSSQTPDHLANWGTRVLHLALD